jgi:hypothetical protein
VGRGHCLLLVGSAIPEAEKCEQMSQGEQETGLVIAREGSLVVDKDTDS